LFVCTPVGAILGDDSARARSLLGVVFVLAAVPGIETNPVEVVIATADIARPDHDFPRRHEPADASGVHDVASGAQPIPRPPASSYNSPPWRRSR
jgi:hypothetical protein